MGKLSTSSVSLEVTPKRFCKADERWIETRLRIRYDYLKDPCLVASTDTCRLERPEYDTLINGIIGFLDRLERRNQRDLFKPVEEFHFLPLETGLKLAFLNGVINDSEGEITIQYMLNLGTIDKGLNFDFIGGEMNIQVSQILQFIEDLKVELRQIE